MIDTQMEGAARLSIAALVGLAAGLEREWSGHASGPNARFAGLRTFFLLGVIGGVIGLLADTSHEAVAAAIALGAAALCVSAYAMAVRRATSDTDGTTEAAALAIIVLGAFAGTGHIGIAAGAGAIVVLMLSEKARLHWLVKRLGEPELRAGVQFAVLAVVVLPLLPAGPLFGPFAVKPRVLWELVLLFSGLSFAGFLASRIVGESRGLGITGALGGAISSTAVTLSFSRQSRRDPELAAPLVRGVLAACTVLIPRVLIVSAVLNPVVAVTLLPLLLPAFVIGLAFVTIGWRSDSESRRTTPRADGNPLRLGAAIRMTVAFQVAMIVITLVARRWGTPGLFTTAGVLGLADVDALTASMARPEANLVPVIAARAIAIGILANTTLKLIVAVALGAAAYRRRAVLGLASLAAGIVLGLAVA
jgi:uncharacterized membrane protein (DUF4010 family)